MPSRANDWWRQAQRDLRHAERSAELGDYEWACFAGQQAAEKALKAVIQMRGGEVRGHSVYALVALLPDDVFAADSRELLASAARELDRHYIPARYPNSIPEGAPFELYDIAQSDRAVAAAERILRFCQRNLA